MPDAPDRLTPAEPRDLADAIAFALRYSGGKRVRDADEVGATIAARRIVEYLREARYRVMKRPLAERAARRELAAPLSAAEPEDVVKAIAFGLRFESGRRVWQADEYMAVINGQAPDRASDSRRLRCLEAAAGGRRRSARARI